MKTSRFLSLLLAVLLAAALLTGCSNAGPAVAKVSGEPITQKDLVMYANYILMPDSTVDDITDAETLKSTYQEALDTAVIYKALLKKATEMKLYPLSDADKKTVADNVSQYLKDDLQALVDTYTEKAASDKSIDPNKRASLEMNARMIRTGLTRENLTAILMNEKAAQLVVDGVMKDITVSDGDLQAGYDEKLKQQTEQFAADPAAYEQAVADEQNNGSPVVLAKPAGYRYVKHILIVFPEDISGKISDAQMKGDTEAVKKLREEGLPKIRARADEALAKVNAGGDFDALMAEYGGDPGMQEDPGKTAGYELGAGTAFVEEFKDAAMKLAKVGDVTGLVATDFGYHIIKWVGDVPSGPVPLADVKDALSAELLQDKQNQAWDAYVTSLKAEYKVEEFPDRFPTMKPAPSLLPEPAITAS